MTPRAAALGASLLALTTTVAGGLVTGWALGPARVAPAMASLATHHSLIATALVVALLGPVAMLAAALAGARGRWWFAGLTAVVAVAEAALTARYAGPLPGWLAVAVAVQVVLLAVAAGLRVADPG